MVVKLRKCTHCQKEYPETKDYFKEYSARGKKYLEHRCKDCLKEYNRNYRRENPEKFKRSGKEYDNSAKGVYKKLKQSSRGHKVLITQVKFVEWYESQPRDCCYCGIKEKELQTLKDAYNNKTYRLSIDRIDSSKNYEVGNLALCCLRCNHIKGNFFTQSEMVEIGQKYIARKWENARQH